MKRITPNEVVDAYIATGMHHVAGMFYDNGCGGCALQALAVHACGKQGSMGGIRELAAIIRLDKTYASFFSHGFEAGDLRFPSLAPDIGRIGHEDGAAARAAVLAHFYPPQEAGGATVEAEPQLVS